MCRQLAHARSIVHACFRALRLHSIGNSIAHKRCRSRLYNDVMEAFIRGLPKAELHLHLEGTLEPELALALAQKHGVPLAHATVEEMRRSYDFCDLQSFL